MLAEKRKYTGWLILPFLVVAVLLAAVLFYMIYMPGESIRGDSYSSGKLESMIAARLKAHVSHLADTIGERHHDNPEALAKAADYIEDQFSNSGFDVHVQHFGGNGRDFRNIIADLPGTGGDSKVLVVGAHYDSVWLSPGADDNASGVAVLLETARLLKEKSHPVTLQFVAFANEEAPFFATPLMGSRVYLDALLKSGRSIHGMMSLEMLGYFDDAANSQHYPFPLALFYPHRGNFLAFVGNLHSRTFLHDAIGAFRKARRLPSAGLAAPSQLVPDIRRSDHYTFWQEGIPALMITDTANFRNPYYHTGGDLPDTLDYDSMSRATTAIAYMLELLARP